MLAPFAGLVNGPEQLEVNFRFQVNSTSDPDNVLPKYQGVSDVTRVSEGLFDITFTEKYPVFIMASGSILAASASGVKVEPVSYTASTGVLRVRCLNAGAVVAAVSDSLLITCPTFANLADADYIEIGDGVNVGVRYEFDSANDDVAAGSIDVGAHTATTAADVAALLVTAIEATQPGLTVVDNLDGTITVTTRAGGQLWGVESISHASGTIARTAGSLASVGDGDAVADPTDDDWVCIRAVFCRRSNMAPSGSI